MRSVGITTREMPTQQWRPSTARKKERNTALKMVWKSKQWCQNISLHWTQCLAPNRIAIHIFIFFQLASYWKYGDLKKLKKQANKPKSLVPSALEVEWTNSPSEKKFQNVKKKNYKWTNTLKYCRVTQRWCWGQLGRINKQAKCLNVASKMGKAFLLQSLAWRENVWDWKCRYVPGTSLEAQA